MTLDKIKIGLIFLLVVLVLSVLTLLFWDFVRDAIVVPVDYLIWVTGLVIRSIPQAVYLAALLLISLALSLNTIDRIRSKPASGNFERIPAQGDTRYHRWLLLSSRQSLSPFYRDIFTTEARNLILSMLAYDHGIDSAEAEARVKAGTLAVPERIRDLIEMRDIRIQPRPVSRIQAVLRWLRLETDSTPDPLLDSLVVEIIDFVEQHGEHV